eukprot:CFRG0631T1
MNRAYTSSRLSDDISPSTHKLNEKRTHLIAHTKFNYVHGHDFVVPGEFGPLDMRNTDRGILPDYPHVQWSHAQLRPQDKEVPWEDYLERRDFEEPLHEDDEILTVWAVDAECSNNITPNEALFTVVLALFGLFGLYKAVNAFQGDTSLPPLARKEMSDATSQKLYQEL